ncbi:MAG: hypothetical protein ACI4UK_05530 [Floccifex sp.]
MEYTRIKLLSRDDPKRLNRIVAVKGDPDLYTLGAIFGFSLNSWFDSCYFFGTQKISYLPDLFLKRYIFSENQYKMSETKLSDLGFVFTFQYDMTDEWIFDCRILLNKFEYECDESEYPLGIVLDGKGFGIIENNHSKFYQFVNGKLKPETKIQTRHSYPTLPDYLVLDSFKDFDRSLDFSNYKFYKDEIQFITDQYYEDPRINYDIIRNEEYYNQIVASKIFSDKLMCETFTRLNKKYNVKEAFHKMAKCTYDTIQQFRIGENRYIIYLEVKKQLDLLD